MCTKRVLGMTYDVWATNQSHVGDVDAVRGAIERNKTKLQHVAVQNNGRKSNLTRLENIHWEFYDQFEGNIDVICLKWEEDFGTVGL